MYTRTEQLSKWMADGGSRITPCWGGRLQMSKRKQLQCGNGLDLDESMNACLVYYRYRWLHMELFIDMCVCEG